MNTTTWIDQQPNPSIGIHDQTDGTMVVRYDAIGRTWYVYIPEGRMITQGHSTREGAKKAAQLGPNGYGGPYEGASPYGKS